MIFLKNVFGINNLKQTDETTVFDGEIFISDRISATLQTEFDKLTKESEKQQKGLKLPLVFTIIKYLLYIVGMGLLGGIIKADISIKNAFITVPQIFYICIASIVGAVIIQLIETSKKKKHLKSDSCEDFVQKSESVKKRAMTELRINQKALSCDILFFNYKEKHGKFIKDSVADFLPVEMFIYADDKNLYIADCTCVFSFSRNEITEIKKISEKAKMLMWNKPEGIRSKKYKKFKMVQDKSGMVTIRDYYSIRLNSRYGEFEILIPPYEIESVAGLININCSE